MSTHTQNGHAPALLLATGSALVAPSSLVPVTFGELYGPVACSRCAGDAWTIWVTQSEKETHSFEHIFRYHGTPRCDSCGMPNAKVSDASGGHRPLDVSRTTGDTHTHSL